MKAYLITFLFLVEVVSAQKSLGVQTYTFRNHWKNGVPQTLQTIKNMGFVYLETGIPEGYTAEKYLKECKDKGLKIIGTGGGYEELVNNPMKVIKTAQELGAKYVTCYWIPHKKGEFNIKDAQKAAADFNAIGKLMKAHDLIFCYHDHGYEFQPYADGTLLDYLIQNTDKNFVFFEMDVLWTMHGGGNPVELLKKYPGRWKLMHVKDLKLGVKGDLTGGTPAENDVVVGTGQGDWPAIFKASKKAGIKYFFIEDESDHEMQNVPQSIKYVNSIK